MAQLFLSHSSADTEFIARLALDLTTLQHTVWLDKWTIRVGDCISQEIDRGLSGCDYVVLALSRAAVQSGWVDREWRSKYVQEVKEQRVIILPVLLEDCNIPPLLLDKRYADFRRSYAVGLVELQQGIERDAPIAAPFRPEAQCQASDLPSLDGLIAELSDPSKSLSLAVSQVLHFARESRREALAKACRFHLLGDKEQATLPAPDGPSYYQTRFIDAYVGVGEDINLGYMGWANDPSRAIQYMKESQKWKWVRLYIPLPLAEIEEAVARESPAGIIKIPFTVGQLVASAKKPDAEMPCYAHGNSYRVMRDKIRADMLRRLKGEIASLGKNPIVSSSAP